MVFDERHKNMTTKIPVSNDAGLLGQSHPSTEKLFELMHPFRTGLKSLREGLRQEYAKYTQGMSAQSKFLAIVPLSVIAGLYIGKLIAD